MRELFNLAVVLDERFDDTTRAATLARVEKSGCTLEERTGADDWTLAWIDQSFGGSWSVEASCAQNVIAHRGGAPVGFASFAPQGLRYRWLRGMALEPGVGVFGPFGVADGERRRGLGGALLTLALCALRRYGYATALIAAVGEDELVRWYAVACGATIAERFDRSALATRARAVLMASAEGTNVEAVARAAQEGRLALDIAAVITNHANAGVRARAQRFDIPDIAIEWKRFVEARDAYDERLLRAVAELQPELVLLLGWMHLLPQDFVIAFPELLNLHPAFLPIDPSRDVVGMPDGSTIPVFRGPRAVRDAIRAGCGWTGSSVHRVTADTDRGAVLMRVPLQLRSGEDEESAYVRLRPMEHALVPHAVSLWLYAS